MNSEPTVIWNEELERVAWLELFHRGRIGSPRYANGKLAGIVILIDEQKRYILRAKDRELDLEPYW